MIIKKIILKGFGKFNNKKVELNDGLNLVYGKNEQGKTTIQKSIEGILYGFYKRGSKNKRYLDEQEKYFPWKNFDGYKGSIDIEVKNSLYTIERNFSKESEDVKVYETITGEDLTSKFNENKVLKMKDPANELLEISYTTFANTISISQFGVKTSDELKEEISEQITRMSTTNDEEISIVNVKKTLEKKKWEIGTEKTKYLGAVVAQINKLNLEYETARENENEILAKTDRIKQYKDEKIKIEQENILNSFDIIEFDNKIARKEDEFSKLEIATKNLEILNKFDIISEKYSTYCSLEKEISRNEQADRLSYIEKEIKMLNIQIKSKNLNKSEVDTKKMNKISILGVILTILSIVFLFAVKNIIFLIGVIIGIIMIIAVINNKRKLANTAMQKLLVELEVKIKTKEEILETNKFLEKEKEIKINNMKSLELEIFNYLKLLYPKCHSINEIEHIKSLVFQVKQINIDIKNMKQKENELKILLEKQKEEKLMNIKININKNQADLENLEKFARSKGEISNEIIEKQKIKDEYIEQIKAIELVIEKIDEVSLEMHKDLSPKLNNIVGKIINEITDGKYSKVYIDKDMKIRVEDSLEERILIDKLSAGTIDLIYIAFRIGLIDFLRGENAEKLPIILDDSFTQFDDERLLNVIENIICKLERQVILFTCHKREKDVLDKLNVKYNYLELD